MASFAPAAYPQGTQVWLPDAEQVWIKAVSFEQTPDQVTFRMGSDGAFVVAAAGKKPGTIDL
eukprot:SAG22_NODE_8651_length_639_cov_1.309259_1_plen_61_part_01